jgi:D-glycerate 3-kinase
MSTSPLRPEIGINHRDHGAHRGKTVIHFQKISVFSAYSVVTFLFGTRGANCERAHRSLHCSRCLHSRSNFLPEPSAQYPEPIEDRLPTFDTLLAAEGLPPSFRATIDRVCLPLAARIVGQMQGGRSCLTVGLCGAQGSGKSTIALVLKTLLVEQGIRVAILSLDDLYLTRSERLALGERVHPLLKTRGVPGTHDVELGIRTIEALRCPGTIAVPSFDKSNDDRRPLDQWPRIERPVQVIVLEGWCVGARPQDSDSLANPINALERDEDKDGVWRTFVNDVLAHDYQRLFALLDTLVLIEAPGFDVVLGWRREQEHKLRQRIAMGQSSSNRAMSDDEVARFVSHYERLTRHILAEMPKRADIVVRLNASRSPIETLTK